MSDRPTPETDAFFYRNGYPVEVDSQKAMRLCERLESERDEAREQNAKLREELLLAIRDFISVGKRLDAMDERLANAAQRKEGAQ